MRRAVAAIALLLVASLLPVGVGPVRIAPALAADPTSGSSADPARTDVRPVTPTGADPRLTPATGLGTSRGPSLGASALSPTVTYIYNPPPNIVVNVPHTFGVFLSNTVDGGTFSLLVDGVTQATVPATSTFIDIVWTPPTKGSISVTASFSGTATLAPSTSDPAVINVIPPYPSSVTVAANPNPVVRNTPTHLTATVTPDPGPGSVDFLVGGEVVASGALTDGVATADASFATPGFVYVQARFLGNDDWSPRLSDFPDLLVNVLGDPVALQVTVPANPMQAGPVTATATLASDPGGGVIQWGWNDYSQPNEVPVGPGGVTQLDLGSLSSGFYHLYVVFPGFGTLARATADITFTVGNPTSTTLVTNRSSATVGELPVVLTAAVTGVNVSPTTVTFLDDVGGVVVPLGPVELDWYTSKASYSSNSLRIGVHTIRARFDGVPGILSSTSAPVIVTVGADTAVHASFSASMATFYPSRDGYKDKVALGGTLDEKATVTIRAYSGSGALKRTWKLGSRSAGKYSIAWDGKSRSHAALRAGRYTVKATFKDTKGHTRTITTHATISWRKAVWKSGSLVTHYGDQLAYYANTVTDLLYYSPDYTRGRTMDTGDTFSDCDPCLEVFGVSTFKLRTDVLAYRRVYVQINGHGYTNRDHTGTSYVLHPGTNAWDYSAPLPDYVGNGITAAIPISKSQITSTHKVTVILDCTEQSGDAFDIHWLQLHYQYAVWK